MRTSPQTAGATDCETSVLAPRGITWARTSTVALVAGFSLSLGSSVATASAAGNDPVSGVCADVAGCRVVAHADINGDGRRDSVGLVREGVDGGADGSVSVRVQVAPSRVVAARGPLEYWYGPVWNGVAPLDGRKGSEIVVGRVMGAHAKLYRALTWRNGGLETLDAPGPNRAWPIDAAYSVSMGWLHRPTERNGLVRSLVAERNMTTLRWRGTVTTYRWSHGSWNRRGSKTFKALREKVAFSWAGFHVPGLKRGLG